MTRHLQAEGEVFGQRLREIRQRRNLTQDAVASAAGLTKAYISDMERGLKIPSLTTLLRLALALDCKVVELVSIFDKSDIAALLGE